MIEKSDSQKAEGTRYRQIEKGIINQDGNSDDEHESPDSLSQELCNTIDVVEQSNMCKKADYFSLLQRVGARGRYQKLSLMIFCLVQLLAGQLLLGTPFLFHNPAYNNCPGGKNDCLDYACSLPQEQRQQLLDPNDRLKTLANTFDMDYHCELGPLHIELTTMGIYLGSCVGYVVMSLLNDNLGRKRSLLIAMTTTLTGLLLTACSFSLAMAAVGLFLTGFGIDASVNTCLYFITETVEDSQRQKHCVFFQSMFSLGGLTNVLLYFLVSDWRLIFCFFYLPHSLVVILLIWTFLKDTPQFMIRFQTVQETLQCLEFIAKVNSKGQQIQHQGQGQGQRQDQGQSENSNEQPRLLQLQDSRQQLIEMIAGLKKSYEAKERGLLAQQRGNLKGSAQTVDTERKVFTPLDLFRFRSIRLKVVCVMVLSFSIYLMYYGPLMLMQKYSLGLFTGVIVMISSELPVFPIFFFSVRRMRRRLWSRVFFAVPVVCSILLLFVMSSDQFEAKLLEISLIFLFRFSISFQFAIFMIYTNELFPSQLRGMGVGFSSALGTIASTLSPLLFGELQKTQFPVMTIFMLFGSMSLISTCFLPETLGKKLDQQVQEFQQAADLNYHSAFNITGKKSPNNGIKQEKETGLAEYEQRNI